ncbi:UNKNOWN [Stylonychia lemnae]|uniref:Cyclin N-terminal domain-containing protein n=1 Tax=Stylonychia lemnae TaxID=5949 RepID=A0A077ZTC0_STYLE|nr:UNKNOWN [Stylonychia lemnae]|eukprot:CDW73127.1 UNKNOWN [Stylonychia lemnae]
MCDEEIWNIKENLKYQSTKDFCVKSFNPNLNTKACLEKRRSGQTLKQFIDEKENSNFNIIPNNKFNTNQDLSKDLKKQTTNGQNQDCIEWKQIAEKYKYTGMRVIVRILQQSQYTSIQTIITALDIFERILQNIEQNDMNTREPEYLQQLAVTCVIISSKYWDVKHISFENLLNANSPYPYTSEEYKNQEILILNYLGFQVNQCKFFDDACEILHNSLDDLDLFSDTKYEEFIYQLFKSISKVSLNVKLQSLDCNLDKEQTHILPWVIALYSSQVACKKFQQNNLNDDLSRNQVRIDDEKNIKMHQQMSNNSINPLLTKQDSFYKISKSHRSYLNQSELHQSQNINDKSNNLKIQINCYPVMIQKNLILFQPSQLY